MESLVTLEQAKAHLKVVMPDFDDDIQLKCEQATTVVIELCNSTAWWRAITASWDTETVPQSVQSAILVLLTHLFENRGDDMKADAEVWATVDRLIRMNKDPVIA